MTSKTALIGAVALAALGGTATADAQEGERGRDGNVSIIYWQAVSILNPYLSGGTKDVEAASLVLEPLARFDPEGNIIPWLVDEVPTVENGGVAEDLTSITWTLSEGIEWSDGTPLTTEDVVFTHAYCTAEGGGCAQGAKFDAVESVEALDERTVRVNFSDPTPYPYTAFSGYESPIIQAAQFADCLGPRAPECTEANFAPVGTGPFVVTDFRVNDVVSFKANETYRVDDQPAFATVTFKSGGDATAAGRAVLETGEFDYAWNLLLSPDVIAGMAEGGLGKPVSAFGTLVERIEVNLTDPSPELAEDVRSTVEAPHPFLTDPAVRAALSMAIDRNLLAEFGYGEAGRPTCDLVPAPELYAAGNEGCFTQDLEGAKTMLEEAGYTDADGDGIREHDEKPMTLLYQTSTSAVRQDFQALIKEWWEEIGFSVELRNIDSGVFFGGDPGSPDTFQRFYADVQMYGNNFPGTDPQAYLGAYLTSSIPSPENGWQGVNVNRIDMPEYEALWREMTRTAELEERGRIAKELNDMVTVDSNIVIPLIDRGSLSAHANSLGGVELNTWDSQLWNIATWHRIAE